jgi:hypothetical protein
MKIIACFAASFLFLQGCTEHSPSPPQQPATSPTALYQRFVPIVGHPESLKGDAWHGTYALDTLTGQLCIPYDPAAFNEISAIPSCATLLSGTPTEGATKVNSTGDHVAFHDGKWQLDDSQPRPTAVSLKEAMALPVNKGKTEQEVIDDIRAHGHDVIFDR